MSKRLRRAFVVMALFTGVVVTTASAGAAQDDPSEVQVDREGRGYYTVELDGPITEDTQEDLVDAGAEILGYSPEFTYLVRMDPAVVEDVTGLDVVVDVVAVPSEDKVAPDLADEGTYQVLMHPTDFSAIEQAAVGIGLETTPPEGRVLLVAGTAAEARSLAELAEVAWIENAPLRETHNEYGAGAVTGTRTANNRGYNGSTQTVAVADTGIGNGTQSGAHVDVPASRITQIFNRPGSAPGCTVIDDGPRDVQSGHGTHTAVSVLGDGNGAGVGRGSAPAADLIFQAVENYIDCGSNGEGYSLVGIPADLYVLYDQAFGAGARIHSNSWGSPVFGEYTTDASTTDEFAFDHPRMLVTFSAGNEGTDGDFNGVVDSFSIGSPGSAKNVLTVGASEGARARWSCAEVADEFGECSGGQQTIPTWSDWWPLDYPAAPLAGDRQAGNIQQMAAFSSRGPTQDGRIKPDVVAPGTWILSGYSSMFQYHYDAASNVDPNTGDKQSPGWGVPFNGSYKYMGGTSMSNPIAAGAAAVVRDFLDKERDYTTPSAALVKAILVNTAVDLLDENNDGANDNDYPIPNDHEGWGRIDVDAATDGSVDYADNMTGIGTGATASYTFTVTAGHPFKVTLVWTDYPGAPFSFPALVNDLDLTVTSPNGTTYGGNSFSNGWSVPGIPLDGINNVENVFVQNPQSGTWTLEVFGFNVPVGPQTFALVGDNRPGSQSRCDGTVATIIGTVKAETFVGTSRRDVVLAQGGADTVLATDGADVVCGGGGNDNLSTGNGADILLGGLGADELNGQAGGDDLFGGAGGDDLNGGTGTDFCDGGAGVDTRASCESSQGFP